MNNAEQQRTLRELHASCKKCEKIVEETEALEAEMDMILRESAQVNEQLLALPTALEARLSGLFKLVTNVNELRARCNVLRQRQLALRARYTEERAVFECLKKRAYN